MNIIALRLPQLLSAEPLHNHLGLWQPGAGQPFFEREPHRKGENLNLFQGYSVRPVPDVVGDIGFCVDVHSKLHLSPIAAAVLGPAGLPTVKGCPRHLSLRAPVV